MADFKVTVENFEEAVNVANQIIKLENSVDKILSDLQLVKLDDPANNSVLNGDPGVAYMEKYDELYKEIKGLTEVVHHRGQLLKDAMGIYKSTDGSVRVDIDGVSKIVADVNKPAADSRWMKN